MQIIKQRQNTAIELTARPEISEVSLVVDTVDLGKTAITMDLEVFEGLYARVVGKELDVEYPDYDSSDKDSEYTSMNFAALFAISTSFSLGLLFGALVL